MNIIVATHSLPSSGPSRVRAMPIRLGQFLITAWLRHQERQVERAVLALDHQGVADDFRQDLNSR